jgi:hypothetical protein
MRLKRGGFWQKAGFFDFKKFAALCRDAATQIEKLALKFVARRTRRKFAASC